MTMKPFNRFAAEAAAVGKLLTGYAVLEIDLMYCVNSVRNDLDSVLKAMFRERGEKRRIDKANELGRASFDKLGLAGDFDTAISAMHHCRQIRNQYAHCVWWDDNTPQLAFGAVEEIAAREDEVELGDLAPNHVNAQFLEQQVSYVEYTDALLLWLIRASNEKQAKPFHPGIQKPATLAQPPLLMP